MGSVHNRKKLFWIAHEGVRSGANNALLDYGEALNKEDFDVTVIMPDLGNMVAECEKRGLNVKLFYYTWTVHYPRIASTAWLRKRARNVVTFFQFCLFAIKHRPSVIITNSIVSTPLFAIAAKVLFIKHIWFIQEFGNKDHGFKFDFGYPLTVRIINAFSSRVIVVADAIKQHISAFTGTSKMVTIFNRVNVPEKYKGAGPSLQQKPFKILHISQVGPTKNQMEGIKALKHLTDEGLDVQLEIAGANLNDAYYKELQQYVSDHQLQSRVNFAGFTTDPYGKIQNSNVVILCSRSEACSLTIFETLQIGTPIIVSHTGGNTEIIKDGETGLVYTYGDPVDLSKKIKQLYADENYAQQLSRNAMAYSATHYSTQTSVDQLKAVLAGL